MTPICVHIMDRKARRIRRWIAWLGAGIGESQTIHTCRTKNRWRSSRVGERGAATTFRSVLEVSPVHMCSSLEHRVRSTAVGWWGRVLSSISRGYDDIVAVRPGHAQWTVRHLTSPRKSCPSHVDGSDDLEDSVISLIRRDWTGHCNAEGDCFLQVVQHIVLRERESCLSVMVHGSTGDCISGRYAHQSCCPQGADNPAHFEFVLRR